MATVATRDRHRSIGQTLRFRATDDEGKASSTTKRHDPAGATNCPGHLHRRNRMYRLSRFAHLAHEGINMSPKEPLGSNLSVASAHPDRRFRPADSLCCLIVAVVDKRLRLMSGQADFPNRQIVA